MEAEAEADEGGDCGRTAEVSPKPPSIWYTCTELMMVSGQTEAEPKRLRSVCTVQSQPLMGSTTVATIDVRLVMTTSALAKECVKNLRAREGPQGRDGSVAFDSRRGAAAGVPSRGWQVGPTAGAAGARANARR